MYILMLAGVVIIGIPLCDKKCGKWGKAAYCAAAAAAFIFIAANRFQVGYDFNLYGGTYFNMKYADIGEVSANRMEKGFLMPLYILNLAFEDYMTVFVYTSIIIYSSVFYLIYRRSSCPWISVAAYMCFGLFFNSLCFLRQTMAALMAAYAVQYIVEKRPLRFIALVIAATSFHWSALIMLAMYLLLRIKPSWLYLGLISAGTLIFCIFSRSLMLWAIDKFYVYRSYNPDTNPEASNGLPVRYTVMFGILFIVCFALRKKLIEKNRANAVYLNCLMYTTVFEAMGTRHGVLSRFAVIVYIPAVLYLIPDAVFAAKELISEKLSGEKRRMLAGCGAAAASSVFAAACFFILMINNYNGTVPYVSYSGRPYDIFVEKLLEEGTDELLIDEEFDGEDAELPDTGGDAVPDVGAETADDVPNVGGEESGRNSLDGIDGFDDETEPEWDYDEWENEEIDMDALEREILNQLGE